MKLKKMVLKKRWLTTCCVRVIDSIDCANDYPTLFEGSSSELESHLKHEVDDLGDRKIDFITSTGSGSLSIWVK